MEDWPATQTTLLARVRDKNDHAAWTQFVETYAPVVYQYGRRQGLQDADASDVTQEVLRSVAGAIGDFRYDAGKGSFRGWLFTITRNKLRNFIAKVSQQERGSGDTAVQRLLEQVPDNEREEAKAWDEEYDRRLLDWAAAKVAGDFAESTWQAFWQTAVEGRSPAEVADVLGLSVGAVYVAKSRVLARIREEIERIEDG